MARQVMGVARVDGAAEGEGSPKKLPMPTHSGQDAPPVQVSVRGEDDMNHIAHIPLVPGGHEHLREDHLLGRNDKYLPPQDHGPLRVEDPEFFNRNGTVLIGVIDVSKPAASSVSKRGATVFSGTNTSRSLVSRQMRV